MSRCTVPRCKNEAYQGSTLCRVCFNAAKRNTRDRGRSQSPAHGRRAPSPAHGRRPPSPAREVARVVVHRAQSPAREVARDVKILCKLGVNCKNEACRDIHRVCNVGEYCPNAQCPYLHEDDFHHPVAKANRLSAKMAAVSM